MKPLFKRCLTWAALSLTVLTSAQAQTFPDNKPVTMVVPFAAGGPTDVVARMLAIPMGKARQHPCRSRHQNQIRLQFDQRE